MHVRHRTLPLALPILLVAGALATACRPAPSRDEALAALRAASPGIDTTTVYEQVWRDGPPWFSCAEVIAKFTSTDDSAAVRDRVGNWRPLVLAGWLVLHDSTRGVLSDPGWCVGRLADSAARAAGGWTQVLGDSFPVIGRRHGWRVPVGTRRLAIVGTPMAAGKDRATAAYVATIAANANGVAVGADRESTFAVAEFQKRDGRWLLGATRLRTVAADGARASP